MNAIMRIALLMLVALAPVPAISQDLPEVVFASSFDDLLCASGDLESEPNDTALAANVLVQSQAGSALVCGEIQPIQSDVDFFQVSFASTSTLRVATVEGDGSNCWANSTMSLTLFGPALNQIATVNTPGADGCLSLDGATLGSLQNLPPGNYYVRVSVTANAPVYALSIRRL